MRKRISLLITAVMLALALSFGSAAAAFADPNCTGNPAERPGSCKITEKGQGKESGPPGPGKFVGPGGGSNPPNH